MEKGSRSGRRIARDAKREELYEAGLVHRKENRVERAGKRGTRSQRTFCLGNSYSAKKGEGALIRERGTSRGARSGDAGALEAMFTKEREESAHPRSSHKEVRAR